jgi:EmrB/QacA subfamily drug resistance transporter
MYSITSRERTFTLVGILVGLFLGALDQTIVGTAMPKVLQELKGLNLYSWVFTAYLLGSTAMIPIYGKLSDLYGRKAILLIGIGIFLAGSALSGQSRSMVELIAFRALQGLGSAGIFSTAFTVIADIFPPSERGKYQGLFGAVFGVSSVVGPWLGGLLTDTISWRWVFYVNLPLGAIALIFIITQMPPLRPELKKKVTIDWLGAALLLVGIVPLLLALSLGGTEFPWGSWQILGLFAIAAVGIAAFIWVETRAPEPIIPFDLFQNRTYVMGNAAAMMIAGVAFFGAILFLPIYMVLVVGATASQAGLTITPLVLGQVVSSFVSGQIVSRVKRYKVVMLVGVAIVFVGYVVMNAISVTTTQAQMTWRMVILGLGLGPAIPVFTLAIQNSVNVREMGAATSSSQFFRQIGATIGVAIFGTLLATTLTARLPQYLPAQMQHMNAQQASMFNMAQLQSGDVSAVGTSIKAGMDQTYAAIEHALEGNDPAAVRSLLESPQVPADMKDLLRTGGVAGRVTAGLDAQYAAIAAALQSGRPAALNAVIQDPGMPPQIKERLSGIPAAALSNPRAVQGILAGLKQGMDSAAPGIIQKATTAALAGIRKALDAQAAELTIQVTSALKLAFTDAVKKVYFWGLFIVALGFVFTLLLPNHELKTQMGARMVGPEGAAEGGAPAGLPGAPGAEPSSGGNGTGKLGITKPAPADGEA